MRKLLICLTCIAFVLACTVAVASYADEEEDLHISRYLIVTANRLNGRAEPSKRAKIECIFDRNDFLRPTGAWSRDYCWVEVYGGETGTVWVSIDFVSEIIQPVRYINFGERLKIRKKPVVGKVRKYLRTGKTVEITQIVNGYGKCKSGWIDMSYLVED